MSNPRILVAGIGNIFLGDDAFGVEVANALMGRTLPDGVRVVDFGINGLDLTYALLEGYEAAILVDAVPRGNAPGTLYLLEVEGPEANRSALSPVEAAQGHNLDPPGVLRLAAAMGSTVRRLFVIGCEPAPLDETDDMKMGLSTAVKTVVFEAVAMVEELVSKLLVVSNGAVGGGG